MKIKNLLFPLLYFFCINNIDVNAQNTWARAYYIDHLFPFYSLDTLTIGPNEIFTTPNGNIISLMQFNEKHDHWIIALDSDGNLLWHKTAGLHGGIQYDEPSNLHGTQDNGCIYTVRHMGSMFTDTVYRLRSNGTIKWHKIYFGPAVNPPEVVYGISQSYYNTTFIQFPDSLVEVDSSGQYIQHRTPFPNTTKINHSPDSDLILTTPTNISKEDFSGNQQWTINNLGFNVSSVNSMFIYARSDSAVVKLDINTGNIYWTKPISSSKLVQSSDLGFIIMKDSLIEKYDSAGVLLWSKAVLLPEYGLTSISELNDKSIVTGGCWKNITLFHPTPSYTGYSPMLLTIDSLGKSITDSTDNSFNGNANDNSILSFGDDAVFIAAAMQHTGLQRDSVVKFVSVGSSIFATEWTDGFATGLNYKYSDLNGDGIIDTSDIISFGQFPFPQNNISTHWLRRTSNSQNPEIRFEIENDSIHSLDTIVVNVILGSTNLPIDSIYGISFNLNFNYLNSQGINAFYSIQPSSIGDTAVDLYLYNLPNTYYPITNMVICRTNHINATIAGDTIVKLYYVLPQIINFQNPISLQIDWNAITEAGFPVSLNLITDTIFFSGTTGITYTDANEINAYPNPTNGHLFISKIPNDLINISIYNNTGQLCRNENDLINDSYFDISNLPDGAYYISIITKNSIINRKVIILH